MINSILNNYADKRVAITGSSGYIAGALVTALQNSNASVLRVSRKLLPEIPSTRVLQTDIGKPDGWPAILAESDIIFHLSSNTSIYAAANDPVDSLQSTLMPLLHLINTAKKNNIKPRVVFASTVTLYGLVDELPVDESKIPLPVTVYDLHKVFAEEQLKLASQQGIIGSAALRLANVYGPSSGNSSASDRGILNKVVKQALAGGGLKIYGDGNYIRDYVYIDDVVTAFLTAGLANNIEGESFNISTGRGITLAQAFKMAAEQVDAIKGTQTAIEYVDWPEAADPLERRNFIGNNRKFSRMAGWVPQVDLEQGIRSLISFYSS